MKVLIIEDERPASQKLIRLIREIDPETEITGALESVEEATNWILSHPDPDLIFMDIQLEDGTCFEIFDACTIQTPVIFTTAYDEYTLKAFKVNSVDYLLKPVTSDDLRKAIEKFKKVHHGFDNIPGLASLLENLKPRTKERFLIKVGSTYRSIQTSDINCFYIKERCNFLHLENGKSYPVDYSLDRVEQMVGSKMFFRVNRNMIVNFSAILRIQAYSSSRLIIMLAGWPEKDEIVVSRERVAAFKKWMDR